MKIQRPKLKVVFIFLIISACLILPVSLYFMRKGEDRKLGLKTEQITPNSLNREELERQRQHTAILDINGNGEEEKVIMHEGNFTVTPPILGYVTVYNSKEEEVARSSEWLGSVPHPIRMTNCNLNKNEKKEYLRMEFSAGPHQFESMFFTLKNNELMPICKNQQPQSVVDCLFYITQDSLIVADIDGDGFSEICEIASVYLSSEELNNDEKKAIDETFEEEAEDAKEIAGMEQGQRIPVIWGIYSFNGKYFEPKVGKAYDWLFDLLTGGNSYSLMKKSEMSQGEIEHTERTRDFWNHR